MDMKKWWKIALLYLICVAGGYADSPTNRWYAQLTSSQKEVFIGQVFSVDVLVNMPETFTPPDLKKLTAFHVTPIQSRTATQTPNTYLFRYAFRAKQAGRQRIPSLKFISPTQTVSTKPVSILVKKPQKTDQMTLSLRLSKTSVYEGEPVLITTTWDSTYPFSAIKSVDFQFPYFADSRFKIKSRFEPNAENKKNATGLPVQGTRVIASRRNYKKSKVMHQSLTFSKVLIPQKSGKITLPSISVLCATEKRNPKQKRKHNYSAFQFAPYFNNTFFDKNDTSKKWILIYTEFVAPTLNVKPLPVENCSKLFNGMVGEYSLSVSAEPIQVQVGEPITLTIEIKSKAFMENIYFPSLHDQPNLLNQFKIPTERALPQLTKTSKIYTQTIWPRSTNLTEIPAIQLAYFSPTSNQYVIAQSAPIQIKVTPAKSIDVFGKTTSPSGVCLACRMVLIAISLVVFAGFVWLTHQLMRRRNARINQAKLAAKAHKKFQQVIRKIEKEQHKKKALYTQIDHALRNYFADRFGFNACSLAFREVQNHLLEKGVDSTPVQEVGALFNLCEAYRFTIKYDDSVDQAHILAIARRLVDQLEKELSSKK